MKNDMEEQDFIYWRHPSIPGIKVEEITGGETKDPKLWMEMARQLYGENGRDSYREIGHYRNGAPFLHGDDSRISVSHTGGILVVATLPRTPEVELGQFNERAAMGVDVERCDREQVLKVRERYLTPAELALIPAGDLQANLLAWTAKEAVYKALLGIGVNDYQHDMVIDRLPKIGPATVVPGAPEFPAADLGEAHAVIDGKTFNFVLYSYLSDDYLITLAYSPKCAKFAKKAR